MYWRHALGDDLPAGHDHDDGDEGRQRHEPHRQAVDAQVVVHVEALDPGSFSTNCIAAVPVSKPVISGRVTRKEPAAPTSAMAAHGAGVLSRPMASSSTPKAIGIQMARLSRPIVLLLLTFLSAPCPSARRPQVGPQPPGQQAEDAQQHHQRIPVEVPGLHQAHQPAKAAHHARRAVDQQAVDQRLVAALPQPGAEQRAPAASTFSLNQSM
jgi:hypothetical protein